MIELALRLPNGATLSNRLAKASMTEAIADGQDRATVEHQRLYQRWAEGGSALLLTGNVMVDGLYLERPRNVVVEDDSGLDELAAWTLAARSSGAHVWMQISHPGRQTPRYVASEPVAPSAVAAVKMMKSFGKPRALEAREIPLIIQRFARTAQIAEHAGFTGVQIHAAHGYLISQFLSPLTNLRSDEWGGSLENRARLLLEIVRAVRAIVTPGFCVSVKLNSADFQRGGFDEDDAIAIARMLESEGVDLLEISGGNYESPALLGSASDRTRAREAYFIDFARRLRQESKMPLMVTGGFRSRAAMEQALEEGACDVIGLARPLALEPDLPRRMLAGETDCSRAAPMTMTIGATTALAEAAFYWMQLRRMGAGLDPDASLSPLRAVLTYVMADFVNAMRRKFRGKSPPALSATNAAAS